MTDYHKEYTKADLINIVKEHEKAIAGAQHGPEVLRLRAENARLKQENRALTRECQQLTTDLVNERQLTTTLKDHINGDDADIDRFPYQLVTGQEVGYVE